MQKHGVYGMVSRSSDGNDTDLGADTHLHGIGRTVKHSTAMKIKLNREYVSVLSEQSGEIVGVFNPSNNAQVLMEKAVGAHFDCECTLVEPRDYEASIEYEQPYVFRLYTGDAEDGSDDEYVTLTMRYTKIY